MIEPRSEIKQVIRISDRAEPREKLVCLDKNERVDPFPPDLLRDLLGDLTSHDVTGYPVLDPFYDELAAWVDVPRDWLLLTAGSDPAIRSVFEVYARPSQGAVMLRPTFAMYPVYGKLFNTQIRELRYDNDLHLSADSVIAALDDTARLLLLPNPNSPTGTVFTEQDLTHILAAAHRHQTLVLIDEAYYYFTSVTALDLVHHFDNLVVTRTFSKAAGLAGVRLGYMVSQPQNIDYLRRVKPMYEINGIALRFGQHIIRYDHILWDYAKQANAGRAYLGEEFSDLGFRVFESHANFLVSRLPAETDISRLVGGLRDSGYLIKGGFSEPPLANCIRVTTASPEILKPFVEVFRRIYPAYQKSREVSR